MKTAQIVLKKSDLTKEDLTPISQINAQLIFIFGSVNYLNSPNLGVLIKNNFPKATVIGCSTAGEISNGGVTDNTLVITGCQFSSASLKSTFVNCSSMEQSEASGIELGKKLNSKDLKSIFVLAPGTNINGSSLVSGLRQELGNDIIITGGLAGDGGEFKKTYTFLNGVASDNQIVAIGFYGDSLKIGYGSMGGWKPFGPSRRVTKVSGNVLYELDGEPALEVYKRYLGDKADELPAAGLRFPFAILNDNEDETGLIRTILGIDEKAGSLTFAGDIPANCLVRLMHTDNDGLINGAEGAAKETLNKNKSKEGIGLLVSCVGRKIVMGDDIEEEIEAVQNVFGTNGVLTGFYSYGEICPFSGYSECKLHNQTMTITWLSEAA